VYFTLPLPATGSSLDGSYDWTDSSWPNGSYTVYPDCTGSLFAADGTKANIIVLDGGKRFSVLSGLTNSDGQGGHGRGDEVGGGEGLTVR
jgi:hypothetical protein